MLSAIHDFFMPTMPVELEDRRELTDVFFRQAKAAVSAQLVMGVITASLAWVRLDSFLVSAWFAFLLAVSGIRLHFIALDRTRTANVNAAGIASLEGFHSSLAGLSGLCWGVIPWLSPYGHDVVLDYLTAAMIFGMAGSATATLAAFPRAFRYFVIPAVLPFSVKAYFIGGDVYITAALVTVFGILALMHFNRMAHQTVIDSIRLRRENLQLVAELREKKVVAEEALRIKSLFLAGVSHDLKHPLNALGLYLGYLKAKPTGAQQAMPGMEQALAGMGNLLTRLLDLSRIESGELVPALRVVDLGEILQRCVARFAAAAAGKNIRLRSVKTKTRLLTDAAMMESIIDNLIGNAVRYTSSGGIVVGLRRRGGTRVFEVWDTGPGIPAERIPLLFDAYRRFDDTKQHLDAGHGLGLALVKKQCELLGYRIEVDSKLGQGSRFAVTLAEAP